MPASGYYIARSPALSEAIELIASGFFSLGDRDRFKAIVDHLRDTYLVCADFDTYQATEARVAQLYQNPRDWARRSLFNIVGASAFSSDNTIRQYASEIWGIAPVKTDLSSVSVTGIERPRDSVLLRRGG